jgi:hypothetical protein
MVIEGPCERHPLDSVKFHGVKPLVRGIKFELLYDPKVLGVGVEERLGPFEHNRIWVLLELLLQLPLDELPQVLWTLLLLTDELLP